MEYLLSRQISHLLAYFNYNKTKTHLFPELGILEASFKARNKSFPEIFFFKALKLLCFVFEIMH